MTDLDIAALRHVAASATPGRWERREYEGGTDPKSRLVCVCDADLDDEYGFERVNTLADYLRREDAEYIVTFAPEKVLALLSEIQTLRNRLHEETT